MNKTELIAALEEECRADRMRIEDFLQALSDLCLEALKRGERFNLGFGAVFAVPRKENGKTRAMIHFKASRKICTELGIADIRFPTSESEGDLCPSCGLREIQKSKECSTCLYHRWMKKNGHTVKPRMKKERRQASFPGLQDARTNAA